MSKNTQQQLAFLSEASSELEASSLPSGSQSNSSVASAAEQSGSQQPSLTSKTSSRSNTQASSAMKAAAREGLSGDEPARKPARKLAPMLQQYVDMKAQYQEHLLLFQVGDFYEVFFDDAVIASEILQIRLTSRDKDQVDPIPMCGVPLHALDNYLPKILAAGRSCVVVSQVEEAGPKGKDAKKGGVRREITRIVTPGVRFEGDGLDAHHYNYLAAVCAGPGELGCVAYVDISTGHLRLRETQSENELKEQIDRIAPSECIIPSIVFDIPVAKDEAWLRGVKQQLQLFETRLVQRPFERVTRDATVVALERVLPEVDREVIDALSPYALCALCALLGYVEEVSFSSRALLASFTLEGSDGSLVIDSATRSNLELVATRLRGEEKHSLLRRIDHTRTAMGARLLSDWILAPSCDLELIEYRLDAVEELCGDDQRLESIRKLLLGVRDLDRLCTRVTSGRANPADLAILRDSIAELPGIQECLTESSSEMCRALATSFDTLEDIWRGLAAALVEEPPVRLGDGGIFAAGHHGELDRIRAIRSEGKSWLKTLEDEERTATGIGSLKIKYNNVFGYFIEVSKAHLAKVPDSYERKQTLVNAERFVTKKLKEREVELLSAQTRQSDLEKELFIALRDEIASHAQRLQHTAHVLATLDVLCSYAYCARQYNYTRPHLAHGAELEITRGRHPVVEAVLGSHQFVPNDCHLNTEDRRLSVLTGPNMGGKSTYLRQVGIIQLLAQAGSFVPAQRASLPVVDRIFTRIGAADDLSRGESTFMVEMRETAVILQRATRRSLVLIDEVGRGTATSDGLAIATSVAEWLLQRIGCMTIFATHFHQLTQLADQYDGAFCLSVGVIETSDSISFTHRIEESRGDRSFGVEVAKLAGLPQPLLDRAAAMLCSIEQMESATGDTPVAAAATAAVENRLPEDIANVLSRLRAIPLDSMTPLQSLQELAELIGMVQNAKYETQ